MKQVIKAWFFHRKVYWNQDHNVQNRPIYLILAVIIVLLYLLSSHNSEGKLKSRFWEFTKSLLGPVMGAQRECPPTGFTNIFFIIFNFNLLFKGNQIVLNEAHVGKGEQLRAGKPRKEDDIEVCELYHLLMLLNLITCWCCWTKSHADAVELNHLLTLLNLITCWMLMVNEICIHCRRTDTV